jgi:hypothetical protein
VQNVNKAATKVNFRQSYHHNVQKADPKGRDKMQLRKGTGIVKLTRTIVTGKK